MKITVKPIQDTTDRTRVKLIEDENGNKRTANITVHTFRTEDKNRQQEPRWEITIMNGAKERGRENDNGGVGATEQEAMNQLEQARTEYQDEMNEEQEKANKPIPEDKLKKATEIAERQRARFFNRDRQEQLRIDPTDSTNTRTEQEHQERVEDTAKEITKLTM